MVDQFPEACISGVRTGRPCVSILVVVDQFPEENSAESETVACEVSILVVVDQFPEEQILRMYHQSQAVSILVVVDQFPEVNNCNIHQFFSKCFNPCCGGSVSGGGQTVCSAGLPGHVSILVVVDQFPEGGHKLVKIVCL